MSRPKKQYTIENIDALLAENAKNYIWLTNAEIEERRNRQIYNTVLRYFMDKLAENNTDNEIKEKINSLSGEELTDVLYGQIQKNFATAQEKTTSIISEGTDSTYWKELDENTIEELRAIFLNDTSEKVLQERFKRATPEELTNVYNNIKFINLFYKWVMNPATNGKQNFYSVLGSIFTGEALKLAKRAMAVICHKYASQKQTKLTTQKAIFEAIGRELCWNGEPPEAITNRGTLEYLMFHPARFTQKNVPSIDKTPKDIAKEITKRLIEGFSKITYEDLAYHYTSKKELPSVSIVTDLMKTVHSDFIEQFSLLNEKDIAKRTGLSVGNYKHYENENSDFVIDVIDAFGFPQKNILTDKIIRNFFTVGVTANPNFRKYGNAMCSKADYLKMFGIDIADKTKVYNFFTDITEQLKMLSSKLLTITSKTGGMAGIHLIDTFDTRGDSIYIRASLELMNWVFKKGYIPDVTTNLALRIPNREPVAYYLQIWLEKLYANRRNVAKDRDYSSVGSLLAYLEKHKLVNLAERKYKEKVINRFINALDYLQNENNSLEYWFFVEDKNKPLEGDELEAYKNKANFSKLYIGYTIPYIEERNEQLADEYNRLLEENTQKEIAKAKKKSKKD